MAKKRIENKDPETTRVYISQADIPGYSLEKAIKVPATIGDSYGYKATTPLQLAKALNNQPTSGGFRLLTGAAIAYGLTIGGYNAESISITPLGLRIVRPPVEGDDVTAKREALLRPRVIREFLQKYDGAPLPKEEIGQNVLLDLGVPQARTADVLKLIVEGAERVGFLHDIKDRKYVDLSNAEIPKEIKIEDSNDESTIGDPPQSTTPLLSLTNGKLVPGLPTDDHARRVFLTHGKNKALIEPIRKLLAFGELEAVVSVQTHTISQPVPGKVMEEMRSCGAAIIHVEDERHLVDKDGNEHVVLNDNVLIEI